MFKIYSKRNLIWLIFAFVLLIFPSGAFVKASNSEGDIEIIKNELEKKWDKCWNRIKEKYKVLSKFISIELFISVWKR